MKITADTNVLVRAAVLDDSRQAELAINLLREAEAVMVPMPALCEFAWVLGRGYRRSPKQVAGYVRSLVAGPVVVVDRLAVEAGLTFLDAGGDFADGVIAFTGRQLGGNVFASFDRRAVDLVTAAGGETHLLGD